jgi:hypothetical protein
VCFPTAEFVKAEGTHPDYYIKWESLPYAEATWEDGSIIEKKWPKKIKEFQDREESKRTPSKHCRVLKHRPKFAQVKSQPVYMGGDQVGCYIYIVAAFICIIAFCVILFCYLCNIRASVIPVLAGFSTTGLPAGWP